jgi:hypothetical protein
MLTNDSLRSVDRRTEASTRRRLLHMTATIVVTAPLVAPTGAPHRRRQRPPPPLLAASGERSWCPDSAVTPPPTGIQQRCLSWPVSASGQRWFRYCPNRLRPALMKRWRPSPKQLGTARMRSRKPPSSDTASAAGRCWPTSAGTGRIEPSPAWSQWPAGSRGRPDLLHRPRTVREHQFRVDCLGGPTDHRAPVGRRPVHGGLA